MKKYVLFDLDGVILDSENEIRRQLAQFIVDLGVECSYSEALVTHGLGFNLTAEFIDQKTGIGFESALDKWKNYRTLLNADYSHLENKDTTALIRKLKENGFKIGVVTNSNQRRLLQKLSSVHVEDLFDVMVYDDGKIPAKPDPTLYLTALKLFGINPEDCIAIEDSYPGFCAAKNANLKVVARIEKDTTVDYSCADYVVTNSLDIYPIIEQLLEA